MTETRFFRMSHPDIGPTLLLPIDAVTQKGAFLGSPGSGKSYASMLLAEQMLDLGAQVIVLDPVGPWYSLRIPAAGPGKAIVVFGGLNGDIPIEPTSGAVIADLICDRGISAVIDLSQFEAEEDMWLFAEEFGRQLFNRRQASPSATALFLEECQEFIPERGTGAKGMNEMARVYRRIQKIGRNYGIGMWLISQRPQEVCKPVLNLSECLFAFQMQGSAEREAIAKWIADKGERADLAAMLPNIERKHAHVWSPRWLKFSETVRIGTRDTFDASATPEVGVVRSAPQALSKINLGEIARAMSETIERRLQEDPEELRKEVARLREQLASTSTVVNSEPVDTSEIEAEAEKRGYSRAAILLSRIAPLVEAIQGLGNEILQVLPEQFDIEESGSLKHGALQGATGTAAITPANEVPVSHDAMAIRAPKAPLRSESSVVNPESGSLPKMHRAFLTTLAQHPVGLPKRLILLHTGYSSSGPVSTMFAELLRAGHVTEISTGLRITDAGKAALGAFEPLPTGKRLRDWLLSGNKLTTMEKRLLNELFLVYPQDLAKGEILKRAQYASSGPVSTAFARLVKFGYATQGARSSLKASDDLFRSSSK